MYSTDDFKPKLLIENSISIFDSFKNFVENFIYHLKDKKIEKTSYTIENAFQKTMLKSRKQTFKTKQGVLKRIYHRDLIWNQNRKNDFKNQQSF